MFFFVFFFSSEPSCSKHRQLNELVSGQMLTVLVSTISNSQVFLPKKCE